MRQKHYDKSLQRDDTPMQPILSQRASEWILTLNNQDNIECITQTCDFAAQHQKESDGLELASVLRELYCDNITIAAGIIYPSILQKPALLEKLSQQFNASIYKIISGVFQMNIIHTIHTENVKITAQQNQIDNLRKMMLAMVDDIRTVLLKLSACLINLKNAKQASPCFQIKIAQETMDYYAPLANRLGIGHLKWQLEDLAFRYLHPEEYHRISKSLHMRRQDREKKIANVIAELKAMLEKNELQNAIISGRAKHIYSIYKKIQHKQKTFQAIYDANAVRILVPTIADCYTALSLVHAKWAPISAEFDDYIAKPKSNGYQSIHTAVLIDQTPVEIQIRTMDMHDRAELGVAAHWKYKENKSIQESEEQKIILLRKLLDWQKNTLENRDKQSQLYQEAFNNRVYVFSPRGDVFDLQNGATPLDFAYLIHSDIGHRCRGAKINQMLVPLTYSLRTGDHIDIITTKENQPSRDWLRADLGFLKTYHAKQKVRQWFRKQDYTKNLANGTAMWEKVCAQQKELQKTDIEQAHIHFNLKNTDSLLAALGAGDIKLPMILNKITVENKPKTNIILSETADIIKNTNITNDFSVLGTKNLLTQIAHCCHPIPGDLIIGYITQGHGITVHQKQCRNIQKMLKQRPERLIEISWENTGKKNYRVHLLITGEDHQGLLHDISGVIKQLNLSILSIQSHTYPENNTVVLELILKISNTLSCDEIIKKIKQVRGISEVTRS